MSHGKVYPSQKFNKPIYNREGKKIKNSFILAGLFLGCKAGTSMNLSPHFHSFLNVVSKARPLCGDLISIREALGLIARVLQVLIVSAVMEN